MKKEPRKRDQGKSTKDKVQRKKDKGQWTIYNGQCLMDNVMDNEQGKIDNGHWTIDKTVKGKRTKDKGRKTKDNGQRTKEKRT